MKSSISISNWIADIVVIVFPVGNVTIRGAMAYTVAGSCAANLWLINDHIAPVSSIAGTANPWVYTDRYKRPHCVCTLLNNGLSIFPAYFMSTGCISFPAPSCCSCTHITELRSFITGCWLPIGSSFIMLGLLWYFRTVLGHMSHFSTIIAHVGPCGWLVLCTLFICPCAGNFWKGLNGRCVWNPYCTFSSNFSATVMTSFRDASVIAYACAFTNPFSPGFRLYIKVCMVLSVAKSGNTTTMLSN